MAKILPVEKDLVDIGLQRQVERECIIVDDSILDVIQLTRNACISSQVLANI